MQNRLTDGSDQLNNRSKTGLSEGLTNSSYAAVNFIQKPSPPYKLPGHDSKGAKTLPGTITVYKTPPPETKRGVKDSTLGT